jgi:hypothetical protein
MILELLLSLLLFLQITIKHNCTGVGRFLQSPSYTQTSRVDSLDTAAGAVP